VTTTVTVTLGPGESAILELLVDNGYELSVAEIAGRLTAIDQRHASIACGNLAALGLARRFGSPVYFATREGRKLIARSREAAK